MTTTDLPVYDRLDISEQLDTRAVSRELARRDQLDGWLPARTHRATAADPGGAWRHGEQRRTARARSLVAYEHLRHRAAQEADLAAWCAQTNASWVSTVTLSRPLAVTELPAWRTYQWQREHPWAVYDEPYQDTPLVQIDERLQDKWRPAPDPQPEPRGPWWQRLAERITGWREGRR